MSNSAKQKKRIVIAGGGTAGWMAAAAFTRLLGKEVDVTLVESSDIGTVGVGEATIPTLVFFHKLLKINEQEFMAATNATFKLGINFENWKDRDHAYLHAFGVTGKDCWAAGFQHFWLRGLKEGLATDFGDYCLERQAAHGNKFAHLPKNGLNYAFHMDATKYALFLRNLAEKEGLTRVDAKIADVTLREDNGFIQNLLLDNGEVIEGDIFIDCTGFRGLLIEKALHTGYEDWSHWLPCDSAVAVQTESVSTPIPYTRSIAREAGWQWRIPLQHRVGNGLVFCSNYVSDDDAISSLMSNIEGTPLTKPRIIRFKTGRRRKQWNKNCLALGLASGFLEPLESTSIHLIQQGIVRFLRMFPVAGIVEEDITEFNRQADFDIEHIRDFIILHYHVTQRTDTPFWRHCRHMDIPESLSHRIELFKKTARVFREGSELFDDSWQQVMIGQGLMPESYHPIVDTMSRQELEALLNGIRHGITKTVEKLPPHQDYIARYCS
ncbi:tryptophan halogenase family protein [Alteromonas sp. C1M14]|uniref:tryptophan halogenase family protein n=1 Tax=Alteromonas sp. C1M14 TaxID=2841567 RepID=UPI001C0A2FA2|nr:tryptophan halogenase family protein [Alteromonas sp. C1M14]MBU2979585.1 tryptophan 7-halogenase [Alteromonas sp. C1M14]